jgi:hypothetical protein
MEIEDGRTDIGGGRATPPAGYAAHGRRLIGDPFGRRGLLHQLVERRTARRPEIRLWLQRDHRPHRKHRRAIAQVLGVMSCVRGGGYVRAHVVTACGLNDAATRALRPRM